MGMTRAQAIEIRTKQINGYPVDDAELQIAVFVIARTVHDPELKIRKKPGRKPKVPAPFPP